MPSREPPPCNWLLKVGINWLPILSVRKRVSQEDLIKELDAAVASGDDKELARVMADIDALGRRR